MYLKKAFETGVSFGTIMVILIFVLLVFMSLRRKTNKNKKVLFVGRPLAAFFLLIKDISFCKLFVDINLLKYIIFVYLRGTIDKNEWFYEKNKKWLFVQLLLVLLY